MDTASVRAALRGFGVMLGPSLLLEAAVGASTAAVATGRLPRANRPAGRLLRSLVRFGAALPWAYVKAIHPWMARWGATDEEVRMPLPGDEQRSGTSWVSTRAITIEAPVGQVWPWLAQVGQDRGGFYSYSWLENLAGARIRNAERIHPEWQQRAVGDRVHLHPAVSLAVKAFEPERAIVLENGWTFALRPLDAGRTRLILRSRAHGWAVLYQALLLDLPHFIMEVGMLRGLKKRAERAAQGLTLLEEVLPSYDFRGSDTSPVMDASPEAIYRACREVTLADMPLAHALGTLRYLPGILTGRMKQPAGFRTRPFLEANTVLAEAPGREVVVGIIGRLHNLRDQQVVAFDGPEAFARFQTPGYQKLAISLRVIRDSKGRGHRLVCEHRTLALGDSARRKFALYWWLLIKSGSSIMVQLMFRAIQRRAEREQAG